MSSKNHIDNAFREKLNSFEKQPPEEIWNEIKNGISAKTKKAIPFLLLRIAAGIAIITGLSVGMYWYATQFRNFDNIAQRYEESNGIKVPGTDSIGEKEGSVQSSDSEPSAGENAKVNPKVNSAGDNTLSSPKVNTEREDTKEKTIIEEKAPKSNTVKDNKNTIEISNPTIEKEDEKNNKNATLKSITIRINFGIASLPIQINPPESHENIPARKISNIPVTWDMLTQIDEIPGTEAESTNDFMLSALVSPIYSYRNVENQKASIYNASENAKISYSGGVHFGINTGSRLSIHTGIVYSRMGIGVDNIHALNVVNNRNMKLDSWGAESSDFFMISNSIGVIKEEQNKDGFISSNSTLFDAGPKVENAMVLTSTNISEVNTQIDQIFHFLEVPLMLKFKVIESKTDFNILGGMSTNFLIGNSVILKSDSEKSWLGTTDDIKTINYSGNIGLGLDYHFNKSLLLSIEPQFKYYLNSINKENNISTRPYSLGFYTGISYNF
jgi:hypothetical protein